MLLITRPRGQGIKTQKTLKNQGIESALEPLMDIRVRSFPLPHLEDVGAIILTSLQAVAALTTLSLHKDCPVFCVGSETARRLREEGFKKIFMSAQGAQDLCALIQETYAPSVGRMIYLSGADISIPLDQLLQSQGYDVTRLICYEGILVPKFSDETCKKIKQNQISGVLLYSKRTAEHFMRLMDHLSALPLLKKMDAYILSPQILSGEHKTLFNRVIFPTVPQEEDLVALIAKNHQEVV